jgi:hypothetical protein
MLIYSVVCCLFHITDTHTHTNTDTNKIMQNEPNFQFSKMLISSYIKSSYVLLAPFCGCKKRTQTNPIYHRYILPIYPILSLLAQYLFVSLIMLTQILINKFCLLCLTSFNIRKINAVVSSLRIGRNHYN